MRFKTGLAGRFFSALGDSKVNIIAIAQGSSERNLSAIVKTEDTQKALQAVHSAFMPVIAADDWVSARSWPMGGVGKSVGMAWGGKEWAGFAL